MKVATTIMTTTTFTSPPPRKTTASTNTNCITLSSYFQKNQHPMRGKKKMIRVTVMAVPLIVILTLRKRNNP